MDKRKRWHGFLIFAVILLTLYNILPSLFYYTKPLNSPVDEKRAREIATSIAERVNALEGESEAWLRSFCKTLAINPAEVHLDAQDPALFVLTFKTARDARTFRAFLPRAGSLIPFAPAGLSLFDREGMDEKSVFVQRRIPLHLAEHAFTFSSGDRQECTLNLDLKPIARAYLNHLKHTLNLAWHPLHPDLKREALPVVDYAAYQALPADQQHFALVLCAPLLHEELRSAGLRSDSLYIIAKGMQPIMERIEREKQGGEQFLHDVRALQGILRSNGFVGYPAQELRLPQAFAQDFVFEAKQYYHSVLSATREAFQIDEACAAAALPFTDVKQRLMEEHRIANRVHEDLLKWRDDYRAAQLNLRDLSRCDVPKPTKNPFIENVLLSMRKYFRGDERKVLHWGLDLSGGKIVDIELRDARGARVVNDGDIALSINELYERVSHLGLAEVSIRKEGNLISLAFPGKQTLSAEELVKAAKMTFHIVNEKFGPFHAELEGASDRFLREVWNEAVRTQRKTVEEVNAIARQLLYGDGGVEEARPQSDAARTLFDNGLRLASETDAAPSTEFNDALSKIVLLRGEGASEWEGRAHPLMIAFAHFALEGSALKDIRSGYDPNHGNYLSFEVQSAHREPFHTWTSRFAKDQIAGTPLENYSAGRGWRMAAVLNDRVISAPELKEPLRDSGMISGSFTQRTISKLESDLRAGSLSFTPHILSEKNISAELGAQERHNGVLATGLALALVILLMVGYYRFAGLIASGALLFNLLILWAVLQNLGAVLTLPGIASIILTLGMAVDANVLVFERIREEFAQTGRLASALQGGYRKAFSAILDSNLTTIIAAFALLQFHCGPIKSFALALIIGIASSMFTALFVTRYVFSGWVRSSERKQLRMHNWFKTPSFDFLKYGKLALILSSALILVGGTLVIAKKDSLLGMDFSGGYALQVTLEPSAQEGYRHSVEHALIDAGGTPQTIHVRELSPPNCVRIDLSRTFDPKTPKASWIVQALQKSGLSLEKGQDLDNSWTEVTGQFSQTMRSQAALGFSLALLAILFYIAFRFEFKYAVGATLCILHDVALTLGVMALLHYFGVPIQIDLITMAALLTIVGYSLNDTIIVFDRIREEARAQTKTPFSALVQRALNATLSRTVMTSGTTLLVLVPLLCLGSSTLFGFSLTMAIGVIFGTLSSLFIAAPLLQFFHRKEVGRVTS